MIKLVICYNDGADAVLPEFPFLTELLANTKAESLQRERAHAYLTLKLSYELLFGASMPTLRKNELGRPEFVGNTVPRDFSVSHTAGLSVIAYLIGEGKVGVDAEGEREVCKNDKIRERFLKNVNINLPNNLKNVEIYFFELSNCALKKIDTPKDFSNILEDAQSDNLPSDFFSLWCTAEATVKADGGGFSSISKTEELLKHASLALFTFSEKKKKYRIALSNIPLSCGEI